MLDSIKKNRRGILFMLISSFCACIGQLLWKISADRGEVYLLFGGVFYGIGAIVMIIAYRFGKLSVLQPMLSLNYVLSILLAHVILKEEISMPKCIGVFVIITGVVLIAGGDKE